MENLFLTGVIEKKGSSTRSKFHLYLPSSKQPIPLPSSGPARFEEERRRSHISVFEKSSNFQKSINGFICGAVKHGSGPGAIQIKPQKNGDDFSAPDRSRAFDFLLSKHPFPLCQGPIILPIDTYLFNYQEKEELSAKIIFENRTMFTHAETQECFEWVPTLTGNNAWNTDIVKVEKYVLRELADPVKTIQGPASIKSMGIIYTCNKMTCVIHCPCTLCNDKKPCKLLCRDEVCGGCNGQCINHQIKLPRLFNSETDLYTLSCTQLDCYRYGIPYAGIPASCSDCSKDLLEHQNLHLVFHTRCRYCRSDLRPFERRNIVTLNDYYEAKQLLKWNDKRTCSFCLVKCKEKHDREEHEKTVHENRGKYRCEICGKTYSNKNALNYHVSNKHSGEETMIFCELCPSKFTTDASLQRHIETVHQESQKAMFECDKCGAKFALLKTLNRHLKEQHFKLNANLDFVEDFESFLKEKCGQCDKSFKRKYQLQRHVKTVHCELKKQFQCLQCECKYSRPDSLRRHVKETHTE